MTNLQSPLPSSRFSTLNSSRLSFGTLDTSKPQIKLLEYSQHRSISKNKQFVKMIHKNSLRRNKIDPSVIKEEKQKNIDQLFESIVREVGMLKTKTGKENSEQQLDQMENKLKKCLNMLRDVDQQQVQSRQTIGKSFLELKMLDILKPKNQGEPYRRQLRNSFGITSLKTFEITSKMDSDSIVEKSHQNRRTNENKPMISCCSQRPQIRK